jgi:hypothetical protein
MKIDSLTIYYALCVALLVASIHNVSTNTHFEADDFQISVDQEFEIVSFYLLVDTIIRLIYPFFLDHMLMSVFCPV